MAPSTPDSWPLTSRLSLWGGSLGYRQVGLILRAINIEIKAGEIYSVVGPNGSGKSMLLKALAGYPESDRIENLKYRLKPRAIGYVPQNHIDGYLPWLSSVDNVALPRVLLGFDRRESRQGAKILLDQLGLGDLAYSVKLSGGQSQATVVGRELFRAPDLLLLDEAFRSIDYQMRLELLPRIRQIAQKSGMGILSVSHDAEEAALFSDWVLFISRRTGRIGNPLAIAGECEPRSFASPSLLRAVAQIQENALAHQERESVT